jgi:hypothetical protein
VRRKARDIDEEDDSKRFSLLERMDSQDTLFIHDEKLDMMSDEDEPLDSPDLYFGEKAKDSFWDFYKSDRKFKDFNAKHEEISDPRQAYFQTCKELGVFPRPKLIIRDEMAPVVEYKDISLISKSSHAVA